MNFTKTELTVPMVFKAYKELERVKEWFGDNISLKGYDKFEAIYSNPWSNWTYITSAISCYIKQEGLSIRSIYADDFHEIFDIYDDVIMVSVDVGGFYDTVEKIQDYLKESHYFARGIIYIPYINNKTWSIRFFDKLAFPVIKPEVLHAKISRDDSLKDLLSVKHNNTFDGFCNFLESVFHSYNVMTLGLDSSDYRKERSWLYLFSIVHAREHGEVVWLVDMDVDEDEAYQLLQFGRFETGAKIICYYRNNPQSLWKQDHVTSVVEDVIDQFSYTRIFSELPPIKRNER